MDAVKEVEVETRYQVLENLYCVLEELSYHCPRGFSALFVEAGYRTLPRNVFLQYLERGIFSLNESFIEDVLSGLGSSRAGSSPPLPPPLALYPSFSSLTPLCAAPQLSHTLFSICHTFNPISLQPPLAPPSLSVFCSADILQQLSLSCVP